MDSGDFTGFSISAAEEALRDGDPVAALEWIDRVPRNERPRSLEAEAAYQSAKLNIGWQRWGVAEEQLERSLAARPSPLAQKRLALIRSRAGLLPDHEWQLLSSTIDPAVTLRRNLLEPEVKSVYACGAYYSRGHRASAPWTRFLRLTKSPVEFDEERHALVSIAAGYMARFMLESTDLVPTVDVVASVPANAGRYVDRGWSFPDELARHLETTVGLPFIFDAVRMDADVELRGLSWRERRQAIQGAMTPGELGLGVDRSVLVIDDVITSGATLRETARVLIAAGAAAVSGLVMSHTEG